MVKDPNCPTLSIRSQLSNLALQVIVLGGFNARIPPLLDYCLLDFSALAFLYFCFNFQFKIIFIIDIRLVVKKWLLLVISFLMG